MNPNEKMTVRDLIARLQTFDQDAVVCVEDKGDLFAVLPIDFQTFEPDPDGRDINGGAGDIITTGVVLAITTRS